MFLKLSFFVFLLFREYSQIIPLLSKSSSSLQVLKCFTYSIIFVFLILLFFRTKRKFLTKSFHFFCYYFL